MGSGGRRGSAGQLRIIGGRWRSRRLGFPAVAGLRPTTDRVRETLFNWLAPQLPGARCADLFAGSGALGLEALSRGAAHCDFVDRSERASSAISKHLHTLGATDAADCYAMTAERFLERCSASYDLVFVDPPFGADLLESTCDLLDTGERLAPGAMIYLETAAQDGPVTLPQRWMPHRQKVMGGVLSRLYTLPG
jgi:16S rRNA (guanine966-N2)-methyltransferase